MLVRNSHVFSGFTALVVAGLLTGCVVTEGSGSGPTTSAATVGSSGTSGEGGAGGEVTTTTVTTSTSGAGGAACVGETGAAVVSDCDKLNITPSTHGGGAAVDCGANLDEEPPGYGLCKHAFEIFNTGAATTLVACLEDIGVQDECKIPPLQDCVDKVYSAECVVDSIATTCNQIKTTCVASNDTFDADKCGADLNPFSDSGLQAVETCINAMDPSVSCQKAYDDCYTQVISF